MPRSKGTLDLYFGFLHESISKQVKEEGYYLPEEKSKYFDKCFDAINQLKFLITDSQYSAICKRLNKEVHKTVEQYLTDEKLK